MGCIDSLGPKSFHPKIHPTRSAERDQHAQRQALLLEFSKQQSCDSVDGNCAGGKAIRNRKKTRGLRGDCLELPRYPRLKLKNMKDKSQFQIISIPPRCIGNFEFAAKVAVFCYYILYIDLG